MQVSDKLITHWQKRLKNMGLLGIRNRLCAGQYGQHSWKCISTNKTSKA